MQILIIPNGLYKTVVTYENLKYNMTFNARTPVCVYIYIYTTIKSNDDRANEMKINYFNCEYISVIIIYFV